MVATVAPAFAEGAIDEAGLENGYAISGICFAVFAFLALQNDSKILKDREAKVQGQISSERDGLSKQAATLSTEVGDLKIKVEKLATDLQKSKAASAKELLAVTAEKNDMEQEKFGLQKELLEAKSDVSRLESSVAMLQKNLEAEKKKSLDLAEEVQKLATAPSSSTPVLQAEG